MFEERFPDDSQLQAAYLQETNNCSNYLRHRFHPILGEIGLYSALLYYFIDIVLDTQLRKHTLKGAIGSFIFGPVLLFFFSIVWINL